MDIYSGNDDQIVPIMSLGGLGVISVLSNVAPAQTHAICQKYLDGDVKESCRLQLEALDLCNALFCEVNPIPVKKALSLMKMTGGNLKESADRNGTAQCGATGKSHERVWHFIKK